jgi:hypothetical protein
MLTAPPGYTHALLRDLEEWRERLGAVVGQIKTLERERDDINKKVVAAEVLLGHGNSESTSTSASMRDAIQRLMADGRVRRPKDIRRDLLATGIDPKKLTSHAGAFYNALLRLAEQDHLKKTPDGRYWDPAKSAGPISLEDMLK